MFFAREVPALAEVRQSLSTRAEAAFAAAPEFGACACCETENDVVMTSVVHALAEGDHMGLNDAAAHAPTEPETVAPVRCWMLSNCWLLSEAASLRLECGLFNLLEVTGLNGERCGERAASIRDCTRDARDPTALIGNWRGSCRRFRFAIASDPPRAHMLAAVLPV